MCKRIKVLSGIEITNPEAFLSGRFKTRIVAFTLGTEFVNVFEVFGSAVNRKSVIIRNSNRFSTKLIAMRIVFPSLYHIILSNIVRYKSFMAALFSTVLIISKQFDSVFYSP